MVHIAREPGQRDHSLRLDGWSRRRFVRSAAVAGTASAAFPAAVAAWQGSAAPRIAIIGAGVAGLNAAYQLKKQGLTAQVYEARDAVGGRMRSETRDGLVFELGGHFVNSDHTDMIDLVDELGLELVDEKSAIDEVEGVPATGYYLGDRMIPERELADLLRPIADQIGDDYDRLDEDWDAVAPELDALSVTDYLDLHADKIPTTEVRALLEGGIRSEYGVEPEESSAIQLIYNLPRVRGKQVGTTGLNDEQFSVAGGSAQVTDALAAELEGQVMVNRSLQRIQHTDAGTYRLKFRSRSGKVTRTEADYVIVAMPFPPFRRVAVDADLPEEFTAFVSESELGRNEKLIGRSFQRTWRTPMGFVGESWDDQEFTVVWDGSMRQPEREDAALTFFTGGAQADKAVKGSSQSVGSRFLRQLTVAIPAFVWAVGKFTRTRWHREKESGGSYASYRPGQLTRFADYFWIEAAKPRRRQEVVFDGLFFIGEHLSDEYYGYMNGAAQTGRLASESLVRMMAA